MSIITHPYAIPEPSLVARRQEEYRRDFIRRHFPTNKSVRILDLGCGYGFFLSACFQCGYTNVTGVEQEIDIAQYARDDLKLPRVITADLIQFIEDEKEQSYDVIVAFNIIEHLKRESIPTTLTRIYALLAQDGLFIMEVPNGDSLLGIHTLYSDITHQGAFTKMLLEGLLARAGFDSLSIYPRFVNSNPIIRAAQKILARVIGLDDRLMFSGNIVAVAKKTP